MAGPAEPITESDFENWLSPRAAIKRLHPELNWHTAVIAIRHSLENAIVFAVAAKVSQWRFRTIIATNALWRVPPSRWIDANFDRKSFWSTGIIEFELMTEHLSDPRSYLACTDVRFKATEIEKLRPHRPPVQLGLGWIKPDGSGRKPSNGSAKKSLDAPEVAAAPESRTAKVGTAALKDWTSAYFAIHPTADFKVVRDAARAHFAPLPVTERPLAKIIADLGMTKPRGRSKG